MISTFACVSCEEPAVVQKLYHVFCQFCWDCLWHEIRIRRDAFRDFGQYYGGNFGVTYYTGEHTLGEVLYLARTPKEAMVEALKTAAMNNWILLRLDVQGASERRLGMRSCTDIFVSSKFRKYMEYSDLAALPYDEEKYGRLPAKIQIHSKETQ